MLFDWHLICGIKYNIALKGIFRAFFTGGGSLDSDAVISGGNEYPVELAVVCSKKRYLNRWESPEQIFLTRIRVFWRSSSSAAITPSVSYPLCEAVLMRKKPKDKPKESPVTEIAFILDQSRHERAP